MSIMLYFLVFFKQKTAYEMRISDWSSDVCSSDLEVVKTLIEAIVLVIVIMYLFLQNWRVTLIPAVAVPVVLMGTFGVLSVLGYSINRSEEHTSELQSLMRISYAVFCLKKKKHVNLISSHIIAKHIQN